MYCRKLINASLFAHVGFAATTNASNSRIIATAGGHGFAFGSIDGKHDFDDDDITTSLFVLSNGNSRRLLPLPLVLSLLEKNTKNIISNTTTQNIPNSNVANTFRSRNFTGLCPCRIAPTDAVRFIRIASLFHAETFWMFCTNDSSIEGNFFSPEDKCFYSRETFKRRVLYAILLKYSPRNQTLLRKNQNAIFRTSSSFLLELMIVRNG
jgi:hypothetical protein